MAKKRFKDTGVGKFLLEKIPNVVGAIAGDTPVGSEIDGTTRRWVADATSGSWLAANVRPLTLVFLTVSYIAGWYMGYPLDSITGLLTIVIGGYFGSRGVEKVFGNSKHK